MSRSVWSRILVYGSVVSAAMVILSAPIASSAAPSRRVVISGDLDVLQEDDFERGRTRRLYRLVDETSGQVLPVKFRRKPADDLITGTRVRLRGVEASGTLTVDDDAGAVVVLAEAPPVMVERRAVTIVVDFSGDASGAGAGSVSCSTTQISSLMYARAQSSGGNVGENYLATSHAQLGWQPDTDANGQMDVVRVAIAASTAESCNSGTWANLADQAATAAGVNLSLYQHRLYVIPNATSCTWAGLANVGCGTWCRAWVKGSSCGTLDVYVHELGHNLGMGHSSTDLDNNGSVDSTCPFWGTSYSGGQYCDRSDFMGIGGDGKRQSNAPHKLQMGWTPAAKVIDAGVGVYELAPLGADPWSTTLPQILRVSRGSSRPFIVSYRTATDPYEDNLRTEYRQRTFVHTHSGGSSNTLLVGYLADGQRLEDSVTGVAIRQISGGATSATVAVEMSSTCVPAAPAVTLSPAQGAARAGDAVSYTALVTNRDSIACGGSTFQIVASVPAGWTSQVGSSTMTLGAGQQGSVTMTVRSSTSAADGIYPVAVTATDTTGPELSGSGTGSATFCIDTQGPAAVLDLTASIKQKNKVQLGWTVPAVTGCASVQRYDIVRDGAIIASTSNTSYLDNSPPSTGTIAYRVIAYDTLGNPSGTGNVASITLGGSSGGGSGGNSGGGKGGGPKK